MTMLVVAWNSTYNNKPQLVLFPLLNKIYQVVPRLEAVGWPGWLTVSAIDPAWPCWKAGAPANNKEI